MLCYYGPSKRSEQRLNETINDAEPSQALFVMLLRENCPRFSTASPTRTLASGELVALELEGAAAGIPGLERGGPL